MGVEIGQREQELRRARQLENDLLLMRQERDRALVAFRTAHDQLLAASAHRAELWALLVDDLMGLDQDEAQAAAVHAILDAAARLRGVLGRSVDLTLAQAVDEAVTALNTARDVPCAP